MVKNIPWTPDQVEILKKSWPTKTGGEIAAMTGKTRNAVMGMAHRLKLPPKAPSGGKRKSFKRFKSKQIKVTVAEKLPEPVPLMEARHGQCRAIIEGIKDKDGLAMVCGKPTVWNKPFSFCSEHFEQYTTRGSNYVRSYPIIK